jgi:predicted transcriptional regulator
MKALLSIKPEYVKKIFSGEKRFEYRKCSFSQKISKVIVYATSPVCRIVGEFDVDGILKDTPDALWTQTKDSSGISEDFFFQYFEGKKCAVAIRIKSTRLYEKEINPYIEWDRFFPPQSFRYIEG